MARVEGTDQLLARLEAMGRTKGILGEMQLGTVREAHILVHRRTGHLRRSIVPGRLTPTFALVEARTPYAAAEELGRRAVTIRPKKAKVLAWGGTRRLSGSLAKGSKPTNFARVVHQPARKGHPYLVPGAKKAIGDLRDALVKLWNKAA